MDNDSGSVIVGVIIIIVTFFLVGLFTGLGQIDSSEERETAIYIKCLESKQDNCTELHNYFINIMDNKDG